MSEVDFLLGKTVVEIQYSIPSNLRIVFETGNRFPPALYADVAGFDYRDKTGETHRVEPDDAPTVGPALAMMGRSVVAVDTDRAILQIDLDDGSALTCEPHEGYEAWEVVGGRPQTLVIAGSEGLDDLIVFDDSPPQKLG